MQTRLGGLKSRADVVVMVEQDNLKVRAFGKWGGNGMLRGASHTHSAYLPSNIFHPRNNSNVAYY